ncbi:MAG: DUF4129 domain-containing protein [Pirellulales bacterium]
MARRLRQSAHDYVVIALSPALIMTLVGSLVFFLITVFYQGAFPARLHWVMACFVFAAVLIGRISIEEGLERAMPFGAALAIVVGIAANRFVEYQGSWVDHFGWLINWTLIGVVWWCAHKLTWDCTVIDDAQDASGEGLMQVVGLERPQGDDAAPDPLEVEGTTSRSVPAGWWRRYVEHQHRPHAPGVWVVYFSLAALPLFGIGQWFIPAASTGARRYVFWLLCVYVASGLGLLVTTSFLGLRRYMRQRHIEMPATMSNLWLGTGAVLIGALLLLAMLLPRPSAEYAISQLPFSVGSPGDRHSTRLAPDPSDAADDGRIGQGQPADSAAEDASDAKGKAEQSGSIRQDDAANATSKQDQGQPNDAADATQPADAGSGQASAGKGAERQSDNASSPSGQSGDAQGKTAGGDRPGQQAQEQQAEQGTGKSADSDARAARVERIKQEVAARRQAQRERQEAQRSKSAQPNEQAEKANDASATPQDGDRKLPDEKRPENGESSAASAAARHGQPGSEQAQTPAPNSSPQPPSIPSPPLGFLAGLFKWAFYAAFALAVCYFVWRYWEDILRAIRDFWAGLWGNKTLSNASADELEAVKIPPAPFSTYADPFAAGVAGRYPLEELVRYSFEAFEAWSREHGCERQPEQTPHELARDVARLNAPMAADARNLAELYSRAAFARGELPHNASDQLQHAWQTMRQTSRAPS